MLTLPSNMTSVDVVQDFLSAIYKHTITTLYRRFDRGVMQMTKIDFVLTVPAIWSDSAKSRMESAAARAGMGNEHRLQLLSEPESAAIYTIKSLDKAHSQFEVHDRVVICDAGGGTVDLISYEIMQIAPQLSVVECTAGTGDFCGSTFIDREFDKLFAQRMGHHYNNVSLLNRQQTVKNFEATKAAFRDDPSQPMFYVNVPTVGTLEQCRVYGGNFEITQGEMRALFDVVIDQVVNLISAQVTKVTDSSHSVNAILLVGGFGESEYLYKRVYDWASPANIQVIQPGHAATSIVRGAVMKGLEPKGGSAKTEIKRRARRSYGVAGSHTFIDGRHLESDAFVDECTGQKMAGNQINWFIRKNQILTDDEKFRYQFSRTFRRLKPWHDRLVACSLDQPPPRREQAVTSLCSVTSDLTHLKRRKFLMRFNKFRPYFTAHYAILCGFENSNLKFTVEFKGQEYGIANVDFDA